MMLLLGIKQPLSPDNIKLMTCYLHFVQFISHSFRSSTTCNLLAVCPFPHPLGLCEESHLFTAFNKVELLLNNLPD